MLYIEYMQWQTWNELSLLEKLLENYANVGTLNGIAVVLIISIQTVRPLFSLVKVRKLCTASVRGWEKESEANECTEWGANGNLRRYRTIEWKGLPFVASAPSLVHTQSDNSYSPFSIRKIKKSQIDKKERNHTRTQNKRVKECERQRQRTLI